MNSESVARRVADLEAALPPPPADVAPLRKAFAAMVARQWDAYVPAALAGVPQGISGAEFGKARFIGAMYARACYSMLLVSARGPRLLRMLVRATSVLPRSRALTLRLGRILLLGLDRLLPRAFHRQLMLMSALMGLLDVVLDQAAFSGQAAVLRVSSLIARPAPDSLAPAESQIATLAEAARSGESAWQSHYWQEVLQPAVREFCLAEALAVAHVPDPTGMGHRRPGIDAAIKGMWYVAGPNMGLEDNPSQFIRSEWTPEQQWMADTSLLMQMIDDWVDQDEDRESRITPAVTGDWSPQTVSSLYIRTVHDLRGILGQGGIVNSIAQEIFVDLYTDYLQAALAAMRSGVAA